MLQAYPALHEWGYPLYMHADLLGPHTRVYGGYPIPSLDSRPIFAIGMILTAHERDGRSITSIIL